MCAYLGQLQKVRAALRDLKIAVTVNEKDAEQLARQGIEEDVEYEEVVVAKHVSPPARAVGVGVDSEHLVGAPGYC